MHNERIGKFSVWSACYTKNPYGIVELQKQFRGTDTCTVVFEGGGTVILKGFDNKADGRWNYSSEDKHNVYLKRGKGEYMTLGNPKKWLMSNI